jgi:hypothetical protein
MLAHNVQKSLSLKESSENIAFNESLSRQGNAWIRDYQSLQVRKHQLEGSVKKENEMKVRKNIRLVTSAVPSQTPFSIWEKRPPLVVGFLISTLRNTGYNVFFLDNYLILSDFLETDYRKES